jgi:hypothetical protein
MNVEQSVEWKLAGETEIIRENLPPVPLCPPQIPHGLTWDRIRAAMMGSQRSTTRPNSESELLYDWRFTVNQFVLALSPLRLTTSNFIFQLNTWDYSPYVTSSLTTGWICRLQLLLAFASTVILRSNSCGTHDHISLSQIRLGGPGPRIYIPQEKDDPVIPPDTGFPFRRPLRLAGIRWRYSYLPPHGIKLSSSLVPCL